jgi:pullulanase/glycogen debranching enzyme
LTSVTAHLSYRNASWLIPTSIGKDSPGLGACLGTRTIVYETHVRGFTRLHPAVPEKHRGTYKGTRGARGR